MDENKPRIIFTIECDSAKDISNYLWDENQKEIILYPARRFKVISLLDCKNQLKVIQLKEVHLHPPLITIPRAPSPAPFSLTPTPDIQYDTIDRCIHHSRADLTGRKLTDTSMNIVVQHAIIKRQCQQLFLSHNLIKSNGSSIIANALNNNNTLTSLSLAYNNLHDEGVRFLADVLSLNNSKLETLSLHSNEIADKGVKYLCDMLKENKTLTWLYLGENKISDIGVQFLAGVLSSLNTTLKALSLARNKSITDKGANHLSEMFQKNKLFETLWIDSCNLSSEGKEKLQQIKKSNKQLFVLTV
jgi:Ran GTPase-activating protein (RanGAP) involved in mRNA processing and transport